MGSATAVAAGTNAPERSRRACTRALVSASFDESNLPSNPPRELGALTSDIESSSQCSRAGPGSVLPPAATAGRPLRVVAEMLDDDGDGASAAGDDASTADGDGSSAATDEGASTTRGVVAPFGGGGGSDGCGCDGS